MQIPLDNPKSDFSKWYSEILLRGDIVDVRTPIKGANVILPNGYALWESVKDILNKKFMETRHKNAYFPLFIPEEFLVRESEHFEGFVPEVAWVTRVGDSELNEKFALRPTSETIMYYMYSQWIKSHGDLPVKINQWANIIRMDTKETRPLLRDREFQWSEAHTCHRSPEEAADQVLESIDIYTHLFDTLGLSYLVLRRPKHDTFPGADYTIAFDSLLPDGRALQIGTTHNLGQSFAKVFDIRFSDEEGKSNFVHQTCYGVSTRVLAALIALHGDDQGLILPPKVAPTQIIVIPIIFKNKGKEAIEGSEELHRELLRYGFRAEVDARENYTAGWKFAEWEMKGVPIRLELGPRDLKNNSVLLVRRDTGEKISISRDNLREEVERYLEEIQSNLKKRADEILESMIYDANTYDELRDILGTKRGFVRINWCGSEACAKDIKDDMSAEIKGKLENSDEEVTGACVVCSETAVERSYVAQSY